MYSMAAALPSQGAHYTHAPYRTQPQTPSFQAPFSPYRFQIPQSLLAMMNGERLPLPTPRAHHRAQTQAHQYGSYDFSQYMPQHNTGYGSGSGSGYGYGKGDGYGHQPPKHYYPPKQYPKPPEPPPPPPPPVIAANQKGGIWGDPHVLNPDSKVDTVTFDSHDTGSFSILKDTGVELWADFIDVGSATTAVGDIALKLGDSLLTIEDKYKVSLDGQPLVGSGELQVNENTRIIKDGAKVDVHTPEYLLTFDVIDGYQQMFQGMWIHTNENGVAKDGVLPTGMLGDFFDADSVVETSFKRPIGEYTAPTGGLSVSQFIDQTLNRFPM